MNFFATGVCTRTGPWTRDTISTIDLKTRAVEFLGTAANPD
jgi:hypothetical protein